MRSTALTYAQSHRAEALASLQQLLRLPSISTLPEHAVDMERTAQWLVEKCTAIGLEHAQMIPTAGGPAVVYADWLHAGPAAPTLLIYGHYDVQPADPLEEWASPPFEPTVKGDNLYGRGANDNKGQFYAHLAALEAYLSSGRLPLNVKLLFEGEEEIGSLHLHEFILQHQDLLRADVAVISDTPIADPQTPVLVTGVRGLVYMEIFMRGSRHDLHSGTYGGAVENPLNAMVKLLASLHDADGRVTVPGFYDSVHPLTPAERQALNNGVVTDETVLAETGAPALWGEAGYTVAERMGARPTLDIHGIKGGFTGVGQKTVIPATASAKVSMRLVPDQDAEEVARLFTEYIYRIAPKTMEICVEKISAGEAAVMVDLATPGLEAAAQAYEQGFGRRPLYMREGGSIPVVGMFNSMLGMPVVMMGFGLPDDALHAPNEKFHLPNFYRGIDTAIHFYDILGQNK